MNNYGKETGNRRIRGDIIFFVSSVCCLCLAVVITCTMYLKQGTEKIRVEYVNGKIKQMNVPVVASIAENKELLGLKVVTVDLSEQKEISRIDNIKTDISKYKMDSDNIDVYIEKNGILEKYTSVEVDENGNIT